jgi:meckelin
MTRENIVLKFFLVAFLMLAICAVLFLIFNFNAYINGSEINQVVDLCTIANVSLLITDETIHGYYLHG